ncbi:hypothetical protein EPUS_04446 [Endocarpon pusillum Z07020]|uniref:Alpha/beta hydrolase fold-3 domain-containing protein n=1 Tax=Endocarpon pusillum (strain Z07020 / HMAS-L-300199) TaxID=1263415 RepID=U1GX24_ENDPU|nr:uncharacterized protein EPUS_04446 [Endocarpon pusillum Z07020]ERF76626.1 hypothetical protein EPUS_04446 [Endocarpon pusillum Z07020]
MAEEELAPFAPEWLAMEQMQGGRMTLMPGPVDEVRNQFQNIFASIRPFLPPRTDAIKTEDSTLPSGMSIRIYQPTEGHGQLPVGLYIHAGGWFAGDMENEDHLVRNIVDNSKILLIQVDYRLCPENPFPAGLDDCCEAYEWLCTNAAKYGGDGSRRFIMGGSSGGNLSTAVALKYASNPDFRASGLIIACPGTCDRRAFPEEYKGRWTPEKYADAPMIGRDMVDWAFELYQAPSPHEPLVSVLLHPDIKLLPPSCIMSPTKDPTNQETVFLYEEMKKQGVDADLVEWEGYPHFFWTVPMLKASAKFMEVWNEKLKGLIGRASS